MNTLAYSQPMRESILAALAASDIPEVASLPIYAEIEEEHLDGECVLIRTESTEEIIPGNGTIKASGSVRVRLSAVVGTHAELLACGNEATRLIMECLPKMRRLEFESCGVLDLLLSAEPPETEGRFYILPLSFRAYLQF